jgi:Na+-transporting NADH:ubiquinone oxidoreductase subunit NqrC
MAQSNKERTVAIAVITVNAVVSILLVMSVVYLFFQVSNLQEENKNLRNKWQKLQVLHECDEKTDHKEVNNCVLSVM